MFSNYFLSFDLGVASIVRYIDSTTYFIQEKTSKGKSPFSGMLELSERRMRVMAKLGLTAPPGSPFL